MKGYIALQSDNSLLLISSHLDGFGDELEGFQNGVYEPGTGIPYWESIYANGDIYAVTLN